MLKYILPLALLISSAHAADIKISALPLGTATAVLSADSFPYVQNSNLVTKRLTLWDIANIPSIVAAYATKASPTFTGTLTAPTIHATINFTGSLIGNASTATAFAANPTDCAANTKAIAIDASGNLTCSSVANADLAGSIAASKLIGSDIATVGTVTAGTWSATAIALSKGGTNANLSAVNGGLIYSTASALAVSSAGSSGQISQSGGAGAPTWSTATYPSAAGSSGNFLISDGTNFISTTQAPPLKTCYGSSTTHNITGSPRWVFVVAKGAGGGGGGSGTGSPGNGGTGGTTTVAGTGIATITATGGSGGQSANGGSSGVAGGSYNNCDFGIPGATSHAVLGNASNGGGTVLNGYGGSGAGPAAGVGGANGGGGGGDVTDNKGGGGGGGGGTGTSISGTGGGEGGICEKTITSAIAPSYTVTIGASGTRGTAGTAGAGGGIGGAGYACFTEFY